MIRPDGKTVRRLRKLAWRLHRPAWVERHGLWLPVRHPAIAPEVARQIYLGDYESREFEIVRDRLEPSDVVLELGAGIGFLSAWCAKRIGSARVTAYEADPALVPILKETYARNRVSPTLVNAMLGPGAGTRPFHRQERFFASSAHRAGGEAIAVRQEDRDEVLARLRPSFLVVDIEGGEAELLRNASLGTVRKICLETHPDVLSDEALSALCAELFAQGFRLDFTRLRKNVFYFWR